MTIPSAIRPHERGGRRAEASARRSAARVAAITPSHPPRERLAAMTKSDSPVRPSHAILAARDAERAASQTISGKHIVRNAETLFAWPSVLDARVP